MTYRGKVQGGVVVFEKARPPEGSRVHVEVVEATPVGAETPAESSALERLRKYSGVLKGLPRDLARNHDHYIHGGPRK